MWLSLAMLWSSGGQPPYCSGAPPRAAPGRGPRAAPARWCGLAHRSQPPREQAAGGAGARGVQVQLRPPPPRRGPFWGRGGVPSAPGGWRVGAPAALKPEGGAGGGGALCRPPPRRPVGCRPAILCLRHAPPGYTRAVGVASGPWVSGAARSAANGSVQRGRGKEGGSGLLALVCAPSFPRLASEGVAPFGPSCAPPVRRLSVAGRAGACGRFTRGASRGRGAPPPPPGRSSLPGECGAAVSPVFLRPLLGLRGGGGASGPLAPPPDGCRGAAWWFRRRGVALFPRPSLP